MVVTGAECLADAWFHNDDPVTNWQTFLQLGEGLAHERDRYRAAQGRHDHAAMDAAAAEMAALVDLLAAARAALDRQKGYFRDGGHQWPLVPI